MMKTIKWIGYVLIAAFIGGILALNLLPAKYRGGDLSACGTFRARIERAVIQGRPGRTPDTMHITARDDAGEVYTFTTRPFPTMAGTPIVLERMCRENGDFSGVVRRYRPQ